MSGIYIKGMEMPKSGAYTCELGVLDENTAVLTINTPINEPQRNYRLIPVPEHGDLIDRDKLEKDIDNYIGGEESRSRFHHWVQVQDAVIPMDKGEEK